MEVRPIDANALLKDKVSNAYISRFEIEDAPTLNYEPVVRCKDCKHCKYYERRIIAHRDHCSKMEKDCSRAECYHAITRKDFERKK